MYFSLKSIGSILWLQSLPPPSWPLFGFHTQLPCYLGATTTKTRSKMEWISNMLKEPKSPNSFNHLIQRILSIYSILKSHAQNVQNKWIHIQLGLYYQININKASTNLGNIFLAHGEKFTAYISGQYKIISCMDASFAAITLTFIEFQYKFTVSIPFFNLQNDKIPRLLSNRRNTASICFYYTMKNVKTPYRALWVISYKFSA